MSDEMDVLFDHRLRSTLHAASLPPAPASLRDALDDLPRTIGTPRRSLPRRVAWGALAASIAVVAFVAWGAIFGQGVVGPGGEATPTPTASPSPAPSPTPEASSSTYDATRSASSPDVADGTIGGEQVIVVGYYSDLRRSPVPCPSFSGAALELGCFDLRQGITDAEVPVGAFVEGRFESTQAPVVHPYWPPSLASDPEATALLEVTSATAEGSAVPVSVTIIGHFDDPLAADCPPDADPPCADRFVVDDVIAFDAPAAASAAAAAPSGSPFPFDSPPPPPTWMENCTQPRDPDTARPGDPVDPALSSEGWVSKSEVPFDFPTHDQVPEMVYFGIVAEAMPLGIWMDDPAAPGERFRWWGTATCVATDSWIAYGWLPGTTFRVYEDGHRVDGGDPFDALPTAAPVP
jgi:hypothetical protein